MRQPAALPGETEWARPRNHDSGLSRSRRWRGYARICAATPALPGGPPPHNKPGIWIPSCGNRAKSPVQRSSALPPWGESARQAHAQSSRWGVYSPSQFFSPAGRGGGRILANSGVCPPPRHRPSQGNGERLARLVRRNGTPPQACGRDAHLPRSRGAHPVYPHPCYS